MMEETMNATRTVQFFISENLNPGGIYEVSVDGKKQFACTCPGFAGRATCKHTKFVVARVKQNHGTYPLEISSRVTDADAEKATESSEAFRDFIIKFGKIEVC
jgi:hypothetical protein